MGKKPSKLIQSSLFYAGVRNICALLISKISCTWLMGFERRGSWYSGVS